MDDDEAHLLEDLIFDKVLEASVECLKRMKTRGKSRIQNPYI